MIHELARWKKCYALVTAVMVLVVLAETPIPPLNYVALTIVLLPSSIIAVPITLVSSALLFGNPNENGILVHIWIYLIWFCALGINLSIVFHIRRRSNPNSF
jgi:hypothetical protein